MEMGRPRTLWTSQCDVAPTIRERFGLQAALNYLISEKLLNFAEAASTRPEFAHELPMFVAQVRRLFTPEEIRVHLEVLIPKLQDAAKPMPKQETTSLRDFRLGTSRPGLIG